MRERDYRQTKPLCNCNVKQCLLCSVNAKFPSTFVFLCRVNGGGGGVGGATAIYAAI